MSFLRFRLVAAVLLSGLALVACKRDTPPPSLEHVSAITPPLRPDVLQRVRRATAYVQVPGASGSGAYIGRQGERALVVTNEHVIRNPGQHSDWRVDVTFDSNIGERRSYEATVLASDRDADLALLSIRVPAELEPLPLGPARGMDEGTALYVLGFPLGKELGVKGVLPSATVNPGIGIKARSWMKLPEHVAPLVAGINPGNSGGPVVDAEGLLRGIAVAHRPGTEASLMVTTEALRELLRKTRGGMESWVDWRRQDAPPPLALEQPPGSPDAEVLKRATVLVRAGTARGGGFVVGHVDEDALVLSNHHTVHGPAGARVKDVQVSATRADGTVVRGAAEILRSDAGDDLAMLRVKGLEGVPMLELRDARHLAATQAIWIVGFPSAPDGSERPEVTRGTLSGQRHNKGAELVVQQVDVGINEGNTGGPVVDASGLVVGVAVARHPETNLSAVVPTMRVKDFMAGALRGGAVKVEHDRLDRCLIDVYAEVDDPLGKLETVGLNVQPMSIKSYYADTERTVVDLGISLAEAKLVNGSARFSAVFEGCRPVKPAELQLQLWTQRKDGVRHVSKPFSVPVMPGSPHMMKRSFVGTYQPGDVAVKYGDFFTTPARRVLGWTMNCGDPENCEQQCELGEWKSCTGLGEYLHTGREGVNPDAKRAWGLFEKACRAEEPEGCERLLQLYPPGTPGLPTPSALLALYRRGCDEGRLPSCFALGLALWQPGRTEADAREAVALFTRACEFNEARSCTMLALALESGRGVPEKSPGKASGHYETGCFEFVSEACHNLATAAVQRENTEYAADLFGKMCKQGFAPSCNDLAVLKARKLGDSAIYWTTKPEELFRQACEAGVAQACQNQREARPEKLTLVGGPVELKPAVPRISEAIAATPTP